MKPSTIDKLVDQYGKKLFAIAYRITGNRQDAEDAVQETFIRIHKNLGNFRGESGLYTWIYRIAVNCSLQLKRRLDRAYLDSLDEKIEEFKHDIPDDVRRWEGDPEKRYLYDSLLIEIRNACYHFMTFRLSDGQRVAYILRVMLGFSLDEIADILQIEKNAAKARLQRAKSNLKSFFSYHCQWGEGKGECTCGSRIGFALAYAPDLLQRVINYPYDSKARELLQTALTYVGTVDDIYSNLPIQPYKTDMLKRLLKGAKK